MIWQIACAALSAIRCAGPATTSAATITATSSSIPTYSAATWPRSLRSMPVSVARRAGARQSREAQPETAEGPAGRAGPSAGEEGLRGGTRGRAAGAAAARGRGRRRGAGRAAVRSSSPAAGGDERVGDDGAGVERHRGGDLAAGDGEQDVAGERRGGVEGGEAGEVGGVDGRAGRTSTGVMAGLLWGRRRAMKEGSRLGLISSNDRA